MNIYALYDLVNPVYANSQNLLEKLGNASHLTQDQFN